jgi:hypothetical protein
MAAGSQIRATANGGAKRRQKIFCREEKKVLG